MTLYGSDAVALGAVFEQVATEFGILYSAAKQGPDAHLAGSELLNFPANPNPLYQHFERVLQRYGSLPKTRHSWLDDQDDASVKYAPIDEGLEMFLYFRRFRKVMKKLAKIFQESASEMTRSGTMEKLNLHINEMITNVLNFSTIVETEHQLKMRLDTLQSKLKNIQKETDEIIGHRNEIIAYLRDQLQEFKNKASMETKYIQKSSNEAIIQAKQKCAMTEKEISTQISDLYSKMQESKRATAEMVSWLFHKNAELRLKCDYLAQKQETDVEIKEMELKDLQNMREKRRDELKTLVFKYDLFEQTVVEHRSFKARQERLRKLAEDEERAALKLQSWWRTTIVTKPIKIKKKRKAKKRAKKGKKITKK